MKIASLENWSRQTCLSLAVIANNIRFLAHPLSQVILADLWMGGLRMRKNPGFKIVIGLLFPPSIATLDFKTKEELELMPQTEEEAQDRDDSDSNSSRYTFQKKEVCAQQNVPAKCIKICYILCIRKPM